MLTRTTWRMMVAGAVTLVALTLAAPSTPLDHKEKSIAENESPSQEALSSASEARTLAHDSSVNVINVPIPGSFATEDKWPGYLNGLLPLMGIKDVDVKEIANPFGVHKLSFWEIIMYHLLKGVSISKVGHKEGILKENEKADPEKVYTHIQFDPVGQLFQHFKHLLFFPLKYGHFDNWWKALKGTFLAFTPFTYNKVGGDDKDSPTGATHVPHGILSLAKKDPIVFVVNVLLLLGWQALFWGMYLPKSGIENAIFDYTDYYDDYEDEGDYEDGEGEGEGEAGDEYDDYAGEEDYEDGGRRKDQQVHQQHNGPHYNSHYSSYSSYNNYYNNYDNAEPIIHNEDDYKSHFKVVSRSDKGRSEPERILGNSFGHGMTGAHAAATLPELGFLAKKK